MSRSANGAGYSQFHDVSVSCSGGPATGVPAVNEIGTRKRTPWSLASTVPSWFVSVKNCTT